MYIVKEIDWVNHRHPQLKLWGIYKRGKYGGDRWYTLITDDREYADKILKDINSEC